MKRIVAGLLITVVMLGLAGCTTTRYNTRHLQNRNNQPHYGNQIENRNFQPYL